MKIGSESEKLEFKKTTAELKEGVISTVAMLNKHGSGELFFGIRNDGTVLGQMVTDKTLRDISQAVANHIQPQLFPKIELVYLDDKQCVRVEATGDDAPYYAFGRAYIRVADEDKVMSPAELEEYILRKNARVITWDSGISDKSAGDIDEAALKDYHERANLAGRINFPYTTKEDALTRLGMLKNGALTNAAAVFFVGAPLLEIQMAIFATTERLTFNDIRREAGNVQQLAAAAEKYIRNNIRWRVVLDGSLQRKEIPEIPMDAVREAIINSFCHKDYKSSQNNTVSIYSNRVEIYNSGTFPEGLTPEDFIEGSEASVKRNPLLAQLMYYVKDIESFGTGLKRITSACESAGVEVEFKLLKLGFAVVFYRPDIFPSNDCDNGDGSITNNITNNITNSITINESQKAILAQMSKDNTITVKKLAEILGIAERNVKTHIKVLKQAALIERKGSPKGGYWVVK
ncbi:MAG: putative DNA binding domain-containing protein [Clostridiales bacterium]|jgi:ATP-dependent DNA helicase RecG|nr:putative DNA binding domain-containing protein [Clostridiales bacterium]